MRTLYGLTLWGLSLAALCLGCTPGKLSETDAKNFRTQLIKYYPPQTTPPDAGGDETPSPKPNTPSQPSQPTQKPDTPTPQEAGSPAPTTAPDMGNGGATDTEGMGGAGNDGTGGAGPGPAVGTIPTCVTDTFQSTCAGSGCHFGGAINQNPDFSHDALFDYLTTTKPSCSDAPGPYVDLDAPDQSYILLKIRGQVPATCLNTRMPPTGSPALTTDQLDCLENWFDSLAK
ncbi:MAG TPA: hypothetical protein VHM70_06400 [Polyangiaceae bacterium]|nr:hypothetical protein [Polyangiaceae bacterium]